VLYERTPGPLSAPQVADDGTVWFLAQSALYALRGAGSPSNGRPADEDDVRSFDAPADIQILSLLALPGGRSVYASTGNVGGVYVLGEANTAAAPQRGTLTSSVLDAKATARWGAIRWTADTPPGAQVFVETRSGDVAEPDATWSAWTSATADNGAPGYGRIASTPARYLQYRVTLPGNPDTALRTVEAFYLTRNQPPTLAITSPRPGEILRGTKILRWSGTDPDRDTLSYRVELSGDGGKTWRSVRAGGGDRQLDGASGGGAPARPAAPAAGTEADTIARVEAQLDQHPDLSPEGRARILAEARRIAAERARALGAATPTTTSPATTAGTRETSLALDTRRWPDGNYLLRVIASDRAANPDEPQTATRVSGEFRIVNRAPTLVLLPRQATVNGDRTATLRGTASHEQRVAIRAVQWRPAGAAAAGEWSAARADDGLFDSPTETFTLTTRAPLAPGAHAIEVQAIDEAGNATTQKTTLTIR
jgi:hypothetical protein